MQALKLPAAGGTEPKAGQRPWSNRQHAGAHKQRTAAAAAAAGETKKKTRGRKAAQGPTAEQLAALFEMEAAQQASVKARRAARMGKDLELSPPEELLSPKQAFEATLPKFLVEQEGSPFKRLDFGVAGEGKTQWWGVQLDDSKHARRFTEYLDKQLEGLQPPGSPPELKHACDVWLPKRTIKAWSERTEKMGNRSEVWHDGVILLRTVMTNEISNIVQRSTAVAGWHKSDSIPGVDAQFPLPFTPQEVDEIQQWQDEKVVLGKADVLPPEDPRLQPPKEMSPADDPRLVERVDLKTGQKRFIYRDEEADRRREEAKARRDAEREQDDGVAGNSGRGRGRGRELPQAASTQIGLSRGDMRPADNGAKPAGSSVDLSDWNVGRNRRGKGPAPIRNTAIDWNVGPTPDASRGWNQAEPRPDQLEGASSNWGSAPASALPSQPAAPAAAAPPGMFGGSGIFDIISNPVEEAAAEAAEAGPQASKALSWQEATIEDDGFPTSSTPQDRDQYWAGPRGHKTPSDQGLELKRPGEQRGRRPPAEQTRARGRGRGNQNTERWTKPPEEAPAKGWYTGTPDTSTPPDDDFWSSVSQLSTADGAAPTSTSPDDDFWSRPIQPDNPPAGSNPMSADDFWSRPATPWPEGQSSASSSQRSTPFSEGDAGGRGSQSQRGRGRSSRGGQGTLSTNDFWSSGPSWSQQQQSRPPSANSQSTSPSNPLSPDNPWSWPQSAQPSSNATESLAEDEGGASASWQPSRQSFQPSTFGSQAGRQGLQSNRGRGRAKQQTGGRPSSNSPGWRAGTGDARSGHDFQQQQQETLQGTGVSSSADGRAPSDDDWWSDVLPSDPDDTPRPFASASEPGSRASTDGWSPGTSVPDDLPDGVAADMAPNGQRRAGGWYTGGSEDHTPQPAAQSPPLETFPTDPDPWGFLKGDQSSTAAGFDGSISDGPGAAGNDDPWGMNDRPLIDQGPSQRGRGRGRGAGSGRGRSSRGGRSNRGRSSPGGGSGSRGRGRSP